MSSSMLKKRAALLCGSLAALSMLGGNAFAVEFGEITSLAHPDKKVSGPAAALSDDGTIYAAWMREEGESIHVLVSSSKDGGKTFTEAVRVNGDNDIPSALHQPPSLALGKKGEVYIAWPASRKGAEFASDIMFSRSVDGGKTFAGAVRVNQDVVASRGFESMTAGRDGAVYLTWLDGREKKQGGSATYSAKSADGVSFSETRVDGGSCPCCRTATATSPEGIVYSSWRKVFKDDNREIVVASSKDGGKSFSSPSVVGNDNWQIAGCPHRGPSLGAAEGGALYVAWYTEGADMAPGVYLAKSNDFGSGFTKKELPWAKAAFPDHPVMTLGKNGPLSVWEETTPVLSKVVFYDGGKPIQMNTGVRRAHDPIISVNSKGTVLVGWVQDEIRRVRFDFRLGK